MINLVLTLVLGVIIGGAGMYIYKAKKKGLDCIGCPSAKTCSGKCGSCEGCCGDQMKANK